MAYDKYRMNAMVIEDSRVAFNEMLTIDSRFNTSIKTTTEMLTLCWTYMSYGRELATRLMHSTIEASPSRVSTTVKQFLILYSHRCEYILYNRRDEINSQILRDDETEWRELLIKYSEVERIFN